MGDGNSLQIERLHLSGVAQASRVENELVWDKGMIYERKRKEINAFAGDEATQGILSKSKAFTFFLLKDKATLTYFLKIRSYKPALKYN